jgi:hypothetical protein
MKQNKLPLFNGLTFLLFIILTNFDQALGMEKQEDQEMAVPASRVLTYPEPDPGMPESNQPQREEKNSEIPTLNLNPIFGCSLPDGNKGSKNKSPRERTKNASHYTPPLPTGRPASSKANSIPSPPGSPRGRGRSRSGSSPRGNLSEALIKDSADSILGSSPRGGKGFAPGFDLYQLHYKNVVDEEASLRKQVSAPSLSQPGSSRSPRSNFRRAKSDPQTIYEKKQGLQEKKVEKVEEKALMGSPESNPSQTSNLRKRRERNSSFHTGRPALMIEDIAPSTIPGLPPPTPEQEKEESVSN